jgi:hypothetical protein
MLLETAKSSICLLIRGPKRRRPASTFLVHAPCVTAVGPVGSVASKDVWDGKACRSLWTWSRRRGLVNLQDGSAADCRPLAGAGISPPVSRTYVHLFW